MKRTDEQRCEVNDRKSEHDSKTGVEERADGDDLARQVSPFAISDIERLCPGVGRDLVRLVLRQLRDEGLVVSSGVGRAATWTRRG